MNAIFIILTVLVIVASILLTLVVLLQNGKGDGLASNFAAGNQTFGVRQTADILEKITWGLCVLVFVLSISSAFVAGGKRDVTKKEVTEAAAAPAEQAATPDFDLNEAAEAPVAEEPAESAEN